MACGQSAHSSSDGFLPVGVGEVHREPEEREIPTDADGARAEVVPVWVDEGDVLELKLGARALWRSA